MSVSLASASARLFSSVFSRVAQIMDGARSSASVQSFGTESAACTGLRARRGIYAVTGADAGLGLATTSALIEAGGVVVMGCADAEKGRVLAAKINGVTKQESAIVLAGGGW
jgi:hypothetical protein